MYSPKSNTPIYRATIVFSFLLIMICSAANAQRRSSGMNADGDLLGGSSYNSGGYIMQDGWAMAISGGYESPQGELKEIYKGTTVFGASVRKRMGNIVYLGTIDYRAYKPRQSSFDYSEDGVSYYTASYSNYTGLGVYAGIAYEVPLGGLLSIYGGANAGFVFTKFTMTAGDGESTFLSASASEKATYIAPKAGFNIFLSEKISLGIEAKYSLGAVGANYNSREGGSITPGFHTLAGNVFLIVQF
ncbi:MAG: outer membrane beta-barrel protein [Bacteroidota bacterium]